MHHECPQCGSTDCIYEEIDKYYDEHAGVSVEGAIQSVCSNRGISDSVSIDLLKANY